MITKWMPLLACVVVLASSLLLIREPAQALPDSSCPAIAGTYNFQMDPAKSFSADVLTDGADPGGILTAPRQDVMRVGVFTINAACGVTGNTMALTDTNTGQTRFIEFDWTGTISDAKGGGPSVRPNGKGFLTINDPGAAEILDCEDMTTDPPTEIVPANCADDEGKEVYAIVFPRPVKTHPFGAVQIDNVDGGAKIFMQMSVKRNFVSNAPAASCDTIRGHYVLTMAPAKSFSADVLTDNADPAGILTAPRQDVGRVGLLDVNADCSASGNLMALTDTNTGETRFIEFNFTGVISQTKGGAAGIRPNGKGFLTIDDPVAANMVDCEDMTTDPPTEIVPADCADLEGKEVYAVVFSRPASGGARIVRAIQIDNVDGGAKIFMRFNGERL